MMMEDLPNSAVSGATVPYAGAKHPVLCMGYGAKITQRENKNEKTNKRQHQTAFLHFASRLPF